MILVPQRHSSPYHFQKSFLAAKGFFQILLHLQKLQTILSRGRTWESRPIFGEKFDVLRKGADPTEEQQQKKNFWQFRCHWSRASQIEGDLHRILSSCVFEPSSSRVFGVVVLRKQSEQLKPVVSTQSTCVSTLDDCPGK
ncbi:hypothetical protein Taro_031716 [Colocasia esculenta]|uniref:Uncharacterized protein n=1 Tax=Colocasia esculenta TaxID=4460 RepID=A0A843VVC8_COLES|nr:hypothetical protein [Colocasia esculenta]